MSGEGIDNPLDDTEILADIAAEAALRAAADAAHAALTIAHGTVDDIADQTDIATHAALTVVHGTVDDIADQTDIETHRAVLDAHTQNIHDTPRVGEYWSVPSGGASAKPLVANILYATPLILARDITFDRMLLQISAAGVGGTKARLGIYNTGANLYPGTLVLDAGLVDVDAAVVVTAVIAQALTKGIYFVAIVTDGAPNVYCNSIKYTDNPILGYNPATLSQSWLQWEVAFVYAALPDPFTAGGALDYSPAPLIPLRITSLD